MTLHEFVYTNHKPQRYYRHIAFWLARFLFGVVSYRFNGFLLEDNPSPIRALDAWRIAAETGCEVLYTYCIVYLIFP
ncbi:MAG: hypothetical protein JST42_16165, partial [Bacteroidetes bacterium]|nr:hypothetical protein [Bacteroidota bacterium]